MTPTAPLLPITLRDLAFRPGGRAVLNGLCATIAAPGITAIIGPSGVSIHARLTCRPSAARPGVTPNTFWKASRKPLCES